MKTGFRSALLAVSLALAGGAGQAENPVTSADLAQLRAAYDFVQAGQYDEALGSYRDLRDGAASSDAVREAATEGQAYAMVSDLRAKMEDAETDTVLARFIKLDRRNTLSFIDGELRSLDTDVMQYIRIAAAEEMALSADAFAGHPFHAELVRLAAVLPEPEPEPVAPEPEPQVSAPPPPATSQPGQSFVATDNARVRAGPGTEYQLSGSLVAGTEVTVIGVVVLDSGKRWYQLAGNRGYVFSSLLQPAANVRRAPDPQPQPQAQTRSEPATVRAPTPAAPAPKPRVAAPSACNGPIIGQYRALRNLPIFAAPGSGQVATLLAGRVLSSVTGSSGGYLVYRAGSQGSGYSCRFVPAGSDNIVRLN